MAHRAAAGRHRRFLPAVSTGGHVPTKRPAIDVGVVHGLLKRSFPAELGAGARVAASTKTAAPHRADEAWPGRRRSQRSRRDRVSTVLDTSQTGCRRPPTVSANICGWLGGNRSSLRTPLPDHCPRFGQRLVDVGHRASGSAGLDLLVAVAGDLEREVDALALGKRRQGAERLERLHGSRRAIRGSAMTSCHSSRLAQPLKARVWWRSIADEAIGLVDGDDAQPGEDRSRGRAERGAGSSTRSGRRPR